jgi:hypothetical protein
MIYSTAVNFTMRFSDLRSHATNTRIFGNPFSFEGSDAPEKLQLELSELQFDSVLHGSFNQEGSFNCLLYFFIGISGF